MIIARAPLRVSFAGGGTDLPKFYERWGPGAVVSTSIDRHVYVTLNEKFDGRVSIRYRDHELPDSVRGLRHDLIREILLDYGVERGVEVVVASEAPARGSGLGASSALAVALCAALDRFTGDPSELQGSKHKEHLAERAARIEIGRVGSPIGKQDHYASAFGGLNFFKFTKEKVECFPFAGSDFVREIESQSMLFYLNREHEYNVGAFVQKTLEAQIREMEEKRKIYELQRDNALQMWEHMIYEVPERFIDHVNENWRLKRSTHPSISDAEIDAVIQRAYESGATAAKVCGAGGGGFIYLVVPSPMQRFVRAAMSGLPELRFGFDARGVEIVFDDRRRRHEVSVEA